MKRIVFVFALVMIFAAGFVPKGFADAGIKVDARINYDDEQILISGTTPARYGQKISVVIYKPQSEISSMADISNRDNPEEDFPLNSLTQIVRMTDTQADYNGNYGPVQFSLSSLDKGFYIVSVSGNGHKSGISKASAIIYFEKQSDIENYTLIEINGANEDEIDNIIRQKELLFGISVDDDYEKNASQITRMFVSVRTNDFGKKYTNMKQVQDTFAIISVLRSLAAAQSENEVQSVCEKNAELIGISQYLNYKDFVDYKEAVYNHLLYIKNINHPLSASDVRKQFLQSMGLATFNAKNASDITDAVMAYGDVLGVAAEDYESACKIYGTVEINKAFTGRNFKEPEEVVEAFESRLENLKKAEGKKIKDNSSSGTGVVKSVGSSYVTPATPSLGAQRFKDVPANHWSFNAVQTLAEMGVVVGNENGLFAPNEYVSREQFVKMLVLTLKLYDDEATSDFSDVEKGRWSEGYIASAAAKSIVNGYEDATFHPADTVIRQDAAVIIYRACSVKNIKLTADNESLFSDGESISGYARDIVNVLSGAGVISGFEDKTFVPFGLLTRAQAAKLIYEIILK